MSKMCSYTKFCSIEVSNTLLYQTLQNMNKKRNRKFHIFLYIGSQVIRNFVAVRQISVVAGTVVGCLNM